MTAPAAGLPVSPLGVSVVWGAGEREPGGGKPGKPSTRRHPPRPYEEDGFERTWRRLRASPEELKSQGDEERKHGWVGEGRETREA